MTRSHLVKSECGEGPHYSPKTADHPILGLLRLVTCASLLCCELSAHVEAYVFITSPPTVWPNGTIPMDLQLGSTLANPLMDGNTSWKSVAENALATWNLYINTVKFTVYAQSPKAPASGDGINQVFFDSTFYGQSFGSGVLAITTTWSIGTTRTEGDTVFNSTLPWNSYRGNLLPAASGGTLLDFQRVALHEFGHTLGLGHPDLAGQNVLALMNSMISNLDHLTTDDTTGAFVLYGGLPPSIVTQPQSRTVTAGNSVAFSVTASGTAPLSYQWYRNNSAVAGATAASYTISATQPSDAGDYKVRVSNVAGNVDSAVATLTVQFAPVITGQPQSQNLTVGESVTLVVVATGVPAPTYQWKFKGTNIPGATPNTYTLGNFQPANAGSYAVVVSNSLGTVTSSSAVLAVAVCVPAPPGLVAWWPGEGNATDVAGGNNGTLSGGVGFAAGKVGQAFSFDGVDGSVVVPDSSSLRFTNELTIEAWINLGAPSTGWAIVSKIGGSGGNNGYQLGLDGNTLGATFNSPGGSWPQFGVSAACPIVPGVWYHVAYTYDQSTMKLYFNGVPVATNVIGSHPINTSSSNLRISGDDNLHVYFDGLIDEVSVYSRALSDGEIAATYNAGSAGKCGLPPTIPGIYDTGVGDSRTVLADGQVDPHYKLVVNSNNPASSDSLVQDSTAWPIVGGPWVQNSSKSKWIGPALNTNGAAAGNYSYQLTLDLTGYDPGTAFLAGSWAADDTGSIFLNGADTGFRSTNYFNSFSTFTLTNGFLSGTNLMEFRITNAAGPTGLRVENLRGTAQKETAPRPQDSPPTISAIADQTTSQNTPTPAIPFTIGDADTAVSNLTLYASSANPALLPTNNIAFGGSDSNRTVTLTPLSGQTGYADITVTVSDGNSTTNTTFRLIVPASTLTLLTQGKGSISPDLSKQTLTPGHIYTITAVPAEGQEFAGWTGGISSPSPRLTFMLTSNLVLQANFVPGTSASAAASIAGTASSTYNGLFYQDDAVRLTSAGSFTVSITTRGKYSGRVQLGAKRYSFSGQLDAQQTGGTNVISRRDGPALTLDFHISGGSRADQISGHLTDGTWASTLSGDRAGFGKANPAPFAGNYTLVIPGYDDSTSLPAGDGFGTVKVDASGKVKFAGTLADGTKVSQSTSLSKNGYWPLHIPLYSGNGCLMSWLAFATQTNSDFSGTLSWIKEAGSKSKYYLGGFTCDCDAFGSTYVRTDPVLNLPTASLTFCGGGLASGITNSITIGSGNKVVTPGKQLKLSFSASTGTFKGTIIDSATGKPLPFSGAVFQKLNTGYGVLLGNGDQTSGVCLAAP